jgi:hypothetical protein
MNWSLPTPLEVESIEERLSGAVMKGSAVVYVHHLRGDEDHSPDVGSGGKKMGNET